MQVPPQSVHVPIPKDTGVLIVSLFGKNRGPKLVEILENHGYQNVTNLGMWQIRDVRVKHGTIERADYLVTLDPRAFRDIMEYGFRPSQKLVKLDVPTFEGEIGADDCRIREPEEIYDDIRKQITPYLSD
jgi:protein-tyrosine-phosphatase